MEGLSSVIKAVCIISAAICMIDCLVAGTRFKNQMKFLLNLVFVTVIITPIINGVFTLELPELDMSVVTEYEDTDELYIEEIKKQTGANISAVLKQQLEASGINCSDIETNINISETNSISINSVTVKADDFEAAVQVIRNSLGAETEVYDGNS